MKPKNILAFRLSAIGDVAMTVPVIMSVLEQNTHCQITMVAPAFLHSFFPEHPRLQLLDYDKKQKHKGLRGVFKFYRELPLSEFDAFADLHSVLRSYLLRNLFKIKGKKISFLKKGRGEKKALTRRWNKKLKPLKPMTERYADVFRALGLKVKLKHSLHNFLFTEFNRDGKKIGIAPFAKHKGKMYPLEKTIQLAQALVNEGYTLYLFGSKQEAAWLKDDFQHPRIEIVAGKLTLRQELSLMNSLSLMISMDSSNMHMASLLGIPVVSIWGATHPYTGFLGYGQTMQNVVQNETLACRPCSIFGNKKCYRKDWACMQRITLREIMSKI